MKNVGSTAIRLLAATLLLCASSNAQVFIPAATAYPQPVLTPAAPTQNDSVGLWLILGQSGNSCVPTYTGSFKITQVSKFVCVQSPCPQNYVISLAYSENPPLLLGRPCLAVVTNYGPQFAFGKLAVGNYTVADSTGGGATVATFMVTQELVSYKVSGSVIRDPGALTEVLPIQNASVYLKTTGISPVLLSSPGAAIAYPLYTIIDSTTTDASGKFTFASVAQGAYDLGIVAAGYQSRDVSMTVPPDTLVSIPMLPVGAICTVTGSVKEEKCPAPGLGLPCSLSPLQGCSVSVYLPLLLQPLAKKSAVILGNSYTAITNGAGLYAIDSIPVTYTGNTVTVTASKSGYAQESSQATLFSNSSVTVNFVLQSSYANAETTTVDDVQFIVATEKSQYVRGDSIAVRYTVMNNSMATVTYDFSSGCQFDMIAMAPPKDTVDWYGRLLACTMMATQIVLAPGGSKSMDFPAFVDNDTASTLAITAKMIGYDKSSSTLIVPVGKTTAALPVPRKVADAKKPVISYSAASKTLSLLIARSQYVSVSAYVVSGQKISQLSTKKFLTAGTHTISLKNASLTNGIIIFRVEGDGFTAVKRVNLIEER
jgi:hypothetical protein